MPSGRAAWGYAMCMLLTQVAHTLCQPSGKATIHICISPCCPPRRLKRVCAVWATIAWGYAMCMRHSLPDKLCRLGGHHTHSISPCARPDGTHPLQPSGRASIHICVSPCMPAYQTAHTLCQPSGKATIYIAMCMVAYQTVAHTLCQPSGKLSYMGICYVPMTARPGGCTHPL